MTDYANNETPQAVDEPVDVFETPVDEPVIPEGFAPAVPDYIDAGSERAMGTTTTLPTQLAHPTKATVRTVVAYVLAALLAGSAGLPVIADMLGAYLPPKLTAVILSTATLCGVLVATFTRLMAVPAINDLLAKIGLDAHK